MYMVIRNPATHGDEDMTTQDALERLATLKLLARVVDRRAVESAEPIAVGGSNE